MKTDHELLIEIHPVLMGVNEQDGLCRQVAKVCHEVDNHKKSIFRLWLAITALVVSLGGGWFGIIKLAGG